MRQVWMTLGQLVAAVVLVAPLLGHGAEKASTSEGQRIYQRDCARCHGATGKGDGEDGMYYTKKPTDFTNRASMAKRNDEFLAAVITQGGPSKGLSADMPATKLSKTEVQAVIAYLRQLAGGSPR
jgi:high-affinity iron transporter